MTQHGYPGPCPPRFQLPFAAFCEANRDAYLRYAEARLADPAAASRCVDAVLGAVGARWVAVLGSASPAAHVWRDLRARIDRQTAGAARLHAVLRGDQADIVLLHRHLGLPVDDAAHLMGLAGCEGRALLRGAERELAKERRSLG
ncbi:hypothetical protein JQK87_00090 [Streptomyces sp. G44]|uniref:hypothetical protein n=1 Tax=Streptomyces sp. G44 TaxID=2807632 RepID=UPI0019605129|nr:hypothetical protein [Streptomyces sp. G44]MBM7166851.1 hypothetical protein [Streptomyces sp. G44]